jgi:UDP-glucuronate 4-epimerase
MKILVTGAAGFIGFHLTLGLLNKNHYVVGIDNLNDYYDPNWKHKRLEKISAHKNSSNFKFIKMDISNKDDVSNLFKEEEFDYVVNLAAQAGVRFSLDNPHSYVDSNLLGFVNILEGCRSTRVKHLVYASSSSVYGMNSKQPFSTNDRVDYPISLYAATKKSNELMAHTYSHLFNTPTTGLRFFTVYGPNGRPDMAYFKFTKAILEGTPIDIFNKGKMKRDFTYIDDIVEGVLRVLDKIPAKEANQYSLSTPPYKIFNIGNNNPITLERFINAIESACGKKAKKNLLEMQPGDVPITYADIDDLKNEIDFKPSTTIEDGIKSFVDWYKGE